MEEQKPDCPCKTLKCERHGNCAVCREYHQTKAKTPLTACDRRDKKAERKARRARGR